MDKFIIQNDEGYVPDDEFTGDPTTDNLDWALFFDSKKEAEQWIKNWPEYAGTNPVVLRYADVARSV